MQISLLCCVCNVCCLYCDLQDLGFLCIVPQIEAADLADCVEFTYGLEVLGHVCRQNHIYHQLPQISKSIAVQVLKEVLFSLFELEEASRGMHVFEDADVVVLDGQSIPRVYQKPVGEAGVCHIMA